jgi:hypothetical protein
MVRRPARVVLDRCTEAFRIAGKAKRHGHDVRVDDRDLRGLWRDETRHACALVLDFDHLNCLAL